MRARGGDVDMAREHPPRRPFRQAGNDCPPWLAARILHLDEEVLVIDKPAGLPVSARTGPDLAALLPALRFGKRRDPQPAHRLDTDTAGCLALGRTAPALAALNRLFAERRVEKVYWAVLRGALPGDAGEIDAPLSKVSTARAGWRMRVDPAGDPARTLWRVLGRNAGATLVEFRPETGRTHQLRVHAAHLGHPILGDAMYGGGAGGLQLLAQRITLPLLPARQAEAPVPAHMQAAISGLAAAPPPPPHRHPAR